MAARGYSDAERLSCGELVYTGLTRSFVMALCPQAPFGGVWTPLACEYFASAADVYRVLGELPEEADQLPTADGREKTVEASCARLARMVGRDAADADAAAWRGLAAWFAEQQLRRIADAAMLVLSRAQLGTVGAGGRRRDRAACDGASCCPSRTALPGFLRRCRAWKLGRADWLGHCAPAVALALLAQDGGLLVR